MMSLFFRFELEKVRKYYATKRVAKVITSILFLLVFLCIGIGIYLFFVSGFSYIAIESEENIRLALTLFLYEVFLLILGGVLVFSGLVSGIFNLFRSSQNNNWIISSPAYKTLPKVIFMRSLLAAGLPLLVMFLPAALALTKVNHLGVLSIISLLFSVVAFLLLLNSLTLSFILCIAFLYYTFSTKVKYIFFSFKGLIILIISILSLFVWKVWNAMVSVDLISLFKAKEVSDTVSVSNITEHFYLLPTHPFAMEIINLQLGETSLALHNLFTLCVLAISALVIFWRYSGIFYPVWQKFQEGNPYILESKQSNFITSTPYYFWGGKTVALFKKEILVSSRNLKGVTWFFFLLFIWLLQIGANVILGHNIQKHEYDISQKIISLQLIQYIIAIYFIASFALRFVFPSFSVEKKTRWIVESAPLSFKKIFFGKYFFYVTFFTVVGIFMNYINSIILKLPFSHLIYSSLLFITAIVFIVTLGLCLGALFPSTETDDPEAISTSMPGLFFTALALLYGALSNSVLYMTIANKSTVLLPFFIVFTYFGIYLLLTKTVTCVGNKRL